MRIGVSADGETIKETKIIPTPKEFDQGILALKQVADELSKEGITGIAGGIAGVLDKNKNALVSSSHIKGWIQKPLKSELERVFGCKAILENDTYVSGMGEAIKGAGVNKKVVAYIALGTGVGGKRIVDGKISLEDSNFEPGHQIIVPYGNLCHCGGKGHLETYVAGAYLDRSKANWDEVAKYLAIGLNNTIVHWSPDIVILGGSVMKSIPLDKVNSYLQETLTIFPQAPEIALAELGDLAGLYGGLTILKTRV